MKVIATVVRFNLPSLDLSLGCYGTLLYIGATMTAEIIYNSIKWVYRDGQATEVEIRLGRKDMPDVKRQYIEKELTENMNWMIQHHKEEGQKYGFFLEVSQEHYDAIS